MPPAVARFLASSAGVQPALLESVKLHATADAAPLTRRGGWPVVLFSPGFGVERELYAGLVEDLASHGYVVVAIDHPHDAGIVEFPDGHVVVPSSQMDIAAALSVRVADTRFVLTELARLGRAGFFAGRLDLGHVGMFGHSLGGAAAASTMLVDPRIDAGADLDGVLFGAARADGLSRPFMLMSADPGFAADPNRAGFWSRLRGPHYAVDVEGARHFAFSDLVFFAPELSRANPSAGEKIGALVGNVDGPATLAAERAYLLAFFDRFLLGNHEPLLAQTPGPFAGVRLTVGTVIAARLCSLERQLGPYDRSGARLALNPELSAERLDAVGEPAKSGAAGQVRAAASVVADLDHDRLGRRRQLDAPFGRAGVLRGVGEALRDDVVEGRFDRFGEPVRRNAGDLDRERRAIRERLQGGREPAVGEDGRVQATGELAELLERLLEVVADARRASPRPPAGRRAASPGPSAGGGRG